jgi:adenosylhomocysteine nucleosidase
VTAATTLPCCVFALRRESRAFRRAFPPRRRIDGAPCNTFLCGDGAPTTLLLETGVGPDRTAEALAWLREGASVDGTRVRPGVVLSAGFAGALQEGLRPGDLIWGSEVADAGGRPWKVSWQGATTDQPPAGSRIGRLLAMTRLVGRPEEKRFLGTRYDALAVDMESAAVARFCTEHEIPFGCLRAISDDVDSRLSPRLLSLLSGGRVSMFKVAKTFAASPCLARDVLRLARHTRKAAHQLGRGLQALLARASK